MEWTVRRLQEQRCLHSTELLPCKAQLQKEIFLNGELIDSSDEYKAYKTERTNAVDRMLSTYYYSAVDCFEQPTFRREILQGIVDSVMAGECRGDEVGQRNNFQDRSLEDLTEDLFRA